MRGSIGVCSSLCGMMVAMSSALAVAEPTTQPAKAFPWDNPFGIVCMWPEVGQIGAVWCRCGGGATQLGDWATIEPERGKFDFTRAEAEYKNQILSEKLTPVPLLCYTAPWASSGPKQETLYPPKDVLDYFRFVKATVSQFKGRIPAYEIWNEPNSRGAFFCGGADELMLLVKAGYCAIKRADPQAKVIYPGLAGTDIPFAERCYELGAAEYFDIMACHPYQWPKVFNEGFYTTEALTGLRGLMDRFGDVGKPIWLNEFGWQLGGEITLDDQARLLAIGTIYYRSLEYLGVERSFWYGAKSWPGNVYGLIDLEGKKTPAFEAYRLCVSNLLGKHYLGRLEAGEARAFVFGKSDSNDPVTIAVWSPTLADIAVSLPMKGAEPMKMMAKPMPQFVTLPREKLAALSNVKRAIPRMGRAADAAVEKMVWAQIVVPADTHRAVVTRGENRLNIRIVNCSDRVQKGVLKLSLPTLAIVREVAYELNAEQATIVDVPMVVGASTKFGVVPVRISGTAGEKKLAAYTDQIRVSPGKTIEFLGNSWIESLYIGKEGAGGGPSVTFGNQWTYRFDLSACTQARLTIDVGANGGKVWNVEGSSDGKEFQVLRTGASWPSRQIIDVPQQYVGKPFWVRIRGDNCMLNYCVLDRAEKAGSALAASEWQ